ncbi:transcription antitermination factor NusB [Corynebacterium hindlerae]|uniref:transcription antitermination factor NusB n=1 Tax=Corynebacterium hindlerae TaxID=699041 RepID=UPI001AD703E4|nr:transcription antitermination factor NusB [Corynebacterium hindlerae]QTH58728.1 transcription antitermination factor NusB [Corynebacterium hindlerae]
MRNDPKRRGARYKARRRAVDILFEAEARDVDPVAVVEDRIELARLPEPPVAPVAPYSQEIVRGVAVELDRIDEAIERFLAETWTLERIPAVDRAILRVATWEILFNPEVPRKTAVVEGIELASEYSTDVAPPYINAVLDDVLSNADEILATPEEVASEVASEDSPEAETS